jgi:Putative beta-barrel porin 2
MTAAWLVLLLLLTPGIAAGQAPLVRPSPAIQPEVPIKPVTPPPPTISSAPELVIPAPPPGATRPVKLFDIRPTLTVGEEYSDNFNQTPNDKVSNFRSFVTPGLLVLFDGGLLTGQGAYTPTAFYDTSPGEANVNHLFASQLAWQATPRLKLSASDAFTESDEPEGADRLNLRRGRQTFRSNTFSLIGEYLFEPYTMQAYYRQSFFSSEDETTLTHVPGVTASVSLARVNILSLGYEYLDTETTGDGTSTFGTPIEDSTTTGHQVTGTFSRELTKLLTGGLTASYAVREESSPTGVDRFTRKSLSLFSNYVLPERIVIRSDIGVSQLKGDSSNGRFLPTTNSDISYYRGPAVFGLRVESGFSETFGQGQNFGVVETLGVSGSMAYAFTPLLSALVTASYRENKFTGEGGGQSGEDETIVSVRANLSYRMFRWLAATLDYTYTDTRSGDPLADYVENRVRIALTALFY